jgi:ABC-type Fe3+-siderophore transport system permease subunit
MLLATLLYVRLDLAHAGAWLSHSGIVTLIVGAAGFALLVQQGQCVTVRVDGGMPVRAMSSPTPPPSSAQWSPISYYEPVRGGKIGQPIPLGVTLYVLQAEYVSRASMPGDYMCKIRIGDGPGASEQTLSLNNPIMAGRFQLTQGSWLPQADPEHPRQIVFQVATRPMIGMIWLGMGMTVAGMLLGFYVRPLLARRRRGK